MSYPVKIGGESVEIGWTQDVAKRYDFRASKIGGAPASRDFTNPKKAAWAVTSFLWLILPPAAHNLYASPEDLFVAIDHETEFAAIGAALAGIMSDMAPDAEKKSTGKKSHSPKSS